VARGYMGKILNVDLSKGTIEEEALDEQLCRDYIGGYGLGAKLLYERMPAGADPLGPDNILGLLTGPLTGTRSSARALWPSASHPTPARGATPTAAAFSGRT
jgi:aldehyde:ferredoxin oxidoreductase